MPQDSIRSSKISRAASLAGAGARVGLNYLKHYGQRAITGSNDKRRLHEVNADAVYKTFSELKGGPLKLAQMLSIDRNILPAAYSRQFAQAQYSAPPLSYPLVARTFRREFGKDPLEMFDTFGREAAHGASIGQVHKATRGNRTFAVKVQYPGVADSLRSDLAVVKPIALQLMGLRERDVASYFKEVEERLLEETDYVLELERSLALSKACSHLDDVRFPKYFPEFSSKRVLTMGWVDGVPLDKFAVSAATAPERDRVGQALWDFYHHQIHTLKQFHADPHPGNFLVKDGMLHVLDFGCTKQLDDAFYTKQFKFLDPALATDLEALERAMEEMEILKPSDSADVRAQFVEICARSIELLARPFRSPRFDFSDPAFMASIYEMGQRNGTDATLRGMKGERGSPHSLYINRTYFGLYSLLSSIGARVETSAAPPLALA